MITTIAVATPATANVPDGPRCTISSTAASSEALRTCDSLMRASLGKELAEVVHLRRRDRRAGVVPRDADVSDDGGHVFVREHVGEGRHPVRPRILARARRIAAVE